MLTREIADGDGDAGDGRETEVIESAEIADDFSKSRVPINDWVLWLLQGSDVSIHFRSTNL